MFASFKKRMVWRQNEKTHENGGVYCTFCIWSLWDLVFHVVNKIFLTLWIQPCMKSLETGAAFFTSIQRNLCVGLDMVSWVMSVQHTTVQKVDLLMLYLYFPSKQYLIFWNVSQKICSYFLFGIPRIFRVCLWCAWLTSMLCFFIFLAATGGIIRLSAHFKDLSSCLGKRQI